MRISEIKGEAAIDVLVDIIDPASEIIADNELRLAIKRKATNMEIVKLVLKNHKKEVIAILAALDGKKPEEYEVNLLTLPVKLLEILNDPELMSLFSLQGQTKTLSGSATVNTEADQV